LCGEVAWDYQRQTAADVVRRLTGVAGVSNRPPRTSMDSTLKTA